MHSPKNLNLFINFFAKSWTTTSVMFYDGQQHQFSMSSLRTILLFTFFIFTYTFFRTTLPLSQYYSVRQLVSTKLVLRLFLFEMEVVTIVIQRWNDDLKD